MQPLLNSTMHVNASSCRRHVILSECKLPVPAPTWLSPYRGALRSDEPVASGFIYSTGTADEEGVEVGRESSGEKDEREEGE